MPTTILLKGKSLERVLLVYLPVALLFFEYQVSWLYEQSPIRIVYGFVVLFLATLFLLRCVRLKFLPVLLLLGVIVSHMVVEGTPKALASTLIFAYGYCVVIKSDSSFSRILATLFLINAVIVICQVLGISSEFYRFQTYSENWTTFISFLKGEKGVIPLHQYRVSGIFPSTIYLSLFQILTFGQLVASPTYGSRAMKFLMGVIFALIASTVSLVLCLLSVIFLLRKRSLVYFQSGFLTGVLLLFSLLPDLYDLNYEWLDRLTRYNTRFIDSGGHSVLTANVFNFVSVLLLLGSLLVVPILISRYRNRLDLLAVLAFLIVCISPMIVHDIVNDIRYWLVVGTACGQFVVATSRWRQKRQADASAGGTGYVGVEDRCPTPQLGSG